MKWVNWWSIVFYFLHACVKCMAWIQQSRKALLPQRCFSAIKEFFISLLPSLLCSHFGWVWIAFSPHTAFAFLSFPPSQWVISTAARSLCGVIHWFSWFISQGFPGQCSLRGEIIKQRLIRTGCYGKDVSEAIILSVILRVSKSPQNSDICIIQKIFQGNKRRTFDAGIRPTVKERKRERGATGERWCAEQACSPEQSWTHLHQLMSLLMLKWGSMHLKRG